MKYTLKNSCTLNLNHVKKYLLGGKPVKADSFNKELNMNRTVYKTVSKSISSWLGLRNDAAHPDTKELNEGLIEPMIAGIKVFIQQYPA